MHLWNVTIYVMNRSIATKVDSFICAINQQHTAYNLMASAGREPMTFRSQSPTLPDTCRRI